jgi:hypothetical protein
MYKLRKLMSVDKKNTPGSTSKVQQLVDSERRNRYLMWAEKQAMDGNKPSMSYMQWVEAGEPD